MTVNNQTTEVTYTGDGVQKDFPVTFAIIDPSQVKWTPYAGNVVEVTPGSGNWVVRFDTAPTGEIYIYRDTPITQETQYNPYDAFPAEAHEKALDKLTQIAQELNIASKWETDSTYLNLSGDTMLEGNTGIDMNGGKITGLADAVDPTDAVSKAYMEANAVAGPPGDPGDPGPPGECPTPIGMIAMWGSNDSSDLVELNAKGWYLCDGGVNASGHPNASMVPNLTNYFVKGGAVGFNVGTFGGSSMTGEHTLSKAQMPSHGHTYATARSSSGKASSGSNLEGVWYDGGAGSTNTSQSQGGGESHSHPNVDPPHFVVAYIIYLGEGA